MHQRGSTRPNLNTNPNPNANPYRRQHDHWWPLLNLEDGSGRRTEAIIQEFRQKHGEKAWVEKLEALRVWAQERMGGGPVMGLDSGVEPLLGIHKHLVWEDVREDGSSDGAVFTWRDSHNA